MSPRSATFGIDSGQLRFTIMRNLTVILRDSNLGAWRPRQIDKTSLLRGRVVTFALSTVSVCDRAKVTTLPRESDVLSI